MSEPSESPASKQIPWPRITAEGAVIVGSILLALAADAWWADRSERRTLVTALGNVTTEISVGRDEIAFAVDDNRSRIALYEKLLTLAPAELLALPADSLSLMGWSFWPPRTFDPGGSALETLLAGGGLNIIRDQELRSALIAWARFPDEIDEDYAIATQATLAFQDHMARHGVVVALLGEEREQLPPGATTVAEALASLRRDTEAMGAIAQLIVAYQDFTDQLADGLPLADRLIEVLSR